MLRPAIVKLSADILTGCVILVKCRRKLRIGHRWRISGAKFNPIRTHRNRLIKQVLTVINKPMIWVMTGCTGHRTIRRQVQIME